MAFITPYTLYLLKGLTEATEKITKQEFIESIYKDEKIYKIFNSIDVQDFVKQIFFLSEGKCFDFVKLKEVEDRADNLKYVFKIKQGKVKYHLFRDCANLNRGFKNFNVPSEFLTDDWPDNNLRIAAIEELRTWFLKNNYTFENVEQGIVHIENIIMRYNAYFPAKYPNLKPLQPNYKLVEIIQAKSPEELKEFKIEAFEHSIKTILLKRYHMCNFSSLYVLSKFDYLYDKTEGEIINIIKEKLEKFAYPDVATILEFINFYTAKNLKKFFINHRLLKFEAKKQLMLYTEWRYNFSEKEYSESFLEKYNLELCKTCESRRNMVKINS